MSTELIPTESRGLESEAALVQLQARDAASSPRVRRPEDVLGIIESLQELIEAERARDLGLVPPEHIPEHPPIWPLPARAEPAVETSPCVVCGHIAATPKYLIQGLQERFVTCDGCGLGSLHPMPSSARIAEFYPAEYYGTPDAKFEPLVEAGVRLGAKLRAATLLKGIPQGGRVLDVGCGRGVMLRGILDLGYEAHGVELNAAAAEGADRRAKIRIAPQLADARYPSSTFDAVILWHVLEHLPQPDQTLDEIARVLKPGGRLIIAVPNLGSWQSRWSGANWFHLDLPRHVYHFSDRTLAKLVDRHGFQVCSTRHFALLQNPFGWLQSALNQLTDAPRNSLYSLLHRYDAPSQSAMTRGQRWLQRTAYWLGLPMAGLLSLVEAAIGQGGTIALTAQLPAKIEEASPQAATGSACACPSLAPC